jgi:hypothetical protein
MPTPNQAGQWRGESNARVNTGIGIGKSDALSCKNTVSFVSNNYSELFKNIFVPEGWQGFYQLNFRPCAFFVRKLKDNSYLQLILLNDQMH